METTMQMITKHLQNKKNVENITTSSCTCKFLIL